MAKLEGTITFTGLPPRRGLIVNLCFFAVAGPHAPVPYNGDPPVAAVTDCDTVFDQVHLKKETQDSTFQCPFTVERSRGYYFVQIRAILFRLNGEKLIAQAEQFFFSRRPVEFAATLEGNVTFPVTWPDIPLEELNHYGTVTPQAKRS